MVRNQTFLRSFPLQGQPKWCWDTMSRCSRRLWDSSQICHDRSQPHLATTFQQFVAVTMITLQIIQFATSLLAPLKHQPNKYRVLSRFHGGSCHCTSPSFTEGFIQKPRSDTLSTWMNKLELRSRHNSSQWTWKTQSIIKYGTYPVPIFSWVITHSSPISPGWDLQYR